MSSRRARADRPAWLLLPLLLALLTSCLSVPTSGPVEGGGTASPAPSGPVEIEPQPPAAGASPALVVEGFLHAMANYRTDYSVAREYLAEEVRDSWRPERAVIVYDSGSPVSTGETVVLDRPLVAVVDAGGAFQRQDRRYRIDFEMRRDAAGEWRIGNPPDGLLISQYLFERFYDDVNVYYFNPEFSTLVPDPIYVPRGSQSATTLLRAMLDGPTSWLREAVVSAVPEGTELGLSIPVDAGGVADVSLSATVDTLNNEQRTRMAAQVVWTLRQLPQITAVRFLVDGMPYVVPGQDPGGVLPLNAYQYFSPVPALDSALYVATEQGIGSTRDDVLPYEVRPLDGPLGGWTEPVAGLAVSNDPMPKAAVVTGDRSRLLVADSAPEAALVTVLEGQQGLLAPQWDRFDELWTAASGPEPGFWVVRDEQPLRVGAPVLEDAELVDFAVSPDATRMAVVRRTAAGTELGLALITRGDDPRVDSWRRLPLVSSGRSGPTTVAAVEWTSATSLLVLGATTPDGPLLPWTVDQDGAGMNQVGSGSWSARSLHAHASDQTAPAAVVGRDGQLWVRETDFSWPEKMQGVRAAAYRG
ncbi:GerMN domain-containing protein [Desertihabitans aurantiacus]|uniref:GerMN domain-containing protein n=1 Tax=Desertihabitans aurantiacus TaxID=2282477 RepID=UPI000DF81E87|nr:GerMN domain-containing protein [Desertihabitans aurantiacus]